jgi:hypothetical protein
MDCIPVAHTEIASDMLYALTMDCVQWQPGQSAQANTCQDEAIFGWKKIQIFPFPTQILPPPASFNMQKKQHSTNLRDFQDPYLDE